MLLTTQQSALTQRPPQNTNYIYSLVEWLIGCTRSWQFLFNGSIFAVQNLGGVRRLSPLLVTHLTTVTDNHMFLSWSFCCKCKPIDSLRRSRKDKFGMVGEICNQHQMRSLLAESGSPSCGRRRNLSLMKKKYAVLTKICWLGRIHHTPKQSHCVRRPVLDMFCVTFYGPRTKKSGYPWDMSFRVNHINLSRKTEKQQILTFSLVSLGLTEIHGFKFGL